MSSFFQHITQLFPMFPCFFNKKIHRYPIFLLKQYLLYKIEHKNLNYEKVILLNIAKYARTINPGKTAPSEPLFLRNCCDFLSVKIFSSSNRKLTVFCGKFVVLFQKKYGISVKKTQNFYVFGLHFSEYPLYYMLLTLSSVRLVQLVRTHPSHG